MVETHDNDKNNGDGHQIEETSESPVSESESYSEEPLDYGLHLTSTLNNESRNSLVIKRKLSKNDADSIVGGESLKNVLDENDIEGRPATAPSDKDDLKEEGFDSTQKVFSFSLPFGGLSNFGSNIYKQIQNIRQEALSPLRSYSDPAKEEIRLRLERQESVSTLAEAEFFKNIKGTDDVRFRAVKHSLSSNINVFLPDFIIPRKEKEKESWDAIYDEIEGNIVVMGGYRGSLLRDTKTHKRVWMPIKAGFNLRRINLLLGPTIDDELNAHKYIYPDGVLKNIGPVDICKKFIKKLEANPKTNVKEFGYDWRLSGPVLAKKFEDFLQNIYDTTGKPTLVICHSMGGLVAHGTLQQNPKLFRSVVYVGSPSECLNILGPIRFGDSVIFSDKILTYETNFMMRSSFMFLPLSGQVFVDRVTRKRYNLDYFDPDTWVEYNLNPLVSKKRKLQEEARASGSPDRSMFSENSKKSNLSLSGESTSPFSSINNIGIKLKHYRVKSAGRRNKSFSFSSVFPGDSPPLTSSKCSESSSQSSTSNTKPEESNEAFSFTFTEAYNYLKDTLKRTKEYVLGLEYKKELESEYPPMAIVYGNNIPSVRGSLVRGIEDIKDGNYYMFYYGHGDGVIHHKFLMPEKKGFNFFDPETGTGQIVGKFSSLHGHVDLMADFKAMGNALVAVCSAERTWQQRKKGIKFHHRMSSNSIQKSTLSRIQELD